MLALSHETQLVLAVVVVLLLVGVSAVCVGRHVAASAPPRPAGSRIPLVMYRTGPFAANAIPSALHDRMLASGRMLGATLQ